MVRREQVPLFETHLVPLTGSRYDIQWVSGGGETCCFVYLAWHVWKSVLSLAVRGNTFSGLVVPCQRVPLVDRHRLPSTASQWELRKVTCGGQPQLLLFFA